jgi:hypothetical protein
MGKPAEDLATYLGTTAVGTAGTDIFVQVPERQLGSGVQVPGDDIVGVIPFGGDTIKSMGGVVAWERYVFQIQIRNVDLGEAEAKAYQVMQAVDGVQSTIVNNTELNYMEVTRAPFIMPPDDKERFRFAVEMRFWRRPEGDVGLGGFGTGFSEGFGA